MALGDTIIIRQVTEMLAVLLTDLGLSVTHCSPAALKTTVTNDNDGIKKVNLYLYQVLENPFAKNQPWKSTNKERQQYPPLALNLYYLLTPYSTEPLDSHELLGESMKIFYDNSIMGQNRLPEALRLTVEQLSISLCPLKIEELTRIWNALQSPYRLSAAYEVKIVLVESDRCKTIGRVKEKMILYSERTDEE